MPVSVLQLVDTLAIGGEERIAVNLANYLPQAGYRSYLCATRSGGPLLASVNRNVETLLLGRRHRFDLKALKVLRDFVRDRKIQILHAHGSALFAARIAAVGLPFAQVIWHAHYGRQTTYTLGALPWRAATAGIAGVIPVSTELGLWAHQTLRVPSGRIRYVPNFIVPADRPRPAPLPGTPGYRVVCVANARPEKGLDILLAAFRAVAVAVPEAHLLLAGRMGDTPYSMSLRSMQEDPALKNSVTFLGERQDVPSILAACDVGVLSSRAEGLPVALLEYGGAGLGSICTDVGQCAEVTGQGEAALLVKPGDPDQLAAAIIDLLRSSSLRAAFGTNLRRRVLEGYSVDAAWRSIQPLYQQISEQAETTAARKS